MHIPRFVPTMLLAVLTGLTACSRNIGPPPDDDTTGRLFTITLDVAEGVTAPEGVLFVGARPAGGGPPAYVTRVQPRRWPTQVFLTQQDAMRPQQPAPQGAMTLFARLDQDGDAGSFDAGDMSAESAPATPGAEVTLTLTPRQQQGQPRARTPRATPLLEATVDGDTPPPSGIVYVLLVPHGQRVPVAAARHSAPEAWPMDVALYPQHLIGDKPDAWDGYQLVVKADQDGNPATNEPGDQRGTAPVEAGRTHIRVTPIAPDTNAPAQP